MKNERNITKNVAKKLASINKSKLKKQDKIKKEIKTEKKLNLGPTEFPEAMAEYILNKIISNVVRQNSIKEIYTHMGKKCFSYIKYLINPYLSTEYIHYENGLDNIELQKEKINYKTKVTEKVNTWDYFPEPKTPGMDRYSSGNAKFIPLKIETDEFKDDSKKKELKDILKRGSPLVDYNAIVNESVEFQNKKQKESNKNIKEKIKEKKLKEKKWKKKEKDSIEKEKEKEIEKKKEEEKILLDLPYEDLPKEKYENKYRVINENEENNELRKEREYLIKKKAEIKALLDLREKKDKLKRYQNYLQKNFDGSKQTFDSEGKIMIIHSPKVENFNNEFNHVKIHNINDKQKKRRSTLKSNTKTELDLFYNNKETKNFDRLPQDIKDIFNYIKDTLVPRWMRKAFMKYSPTKKENDQNAQRKRNSANKSFKLFFGPFLKKYVFKKNVIRNPKDVMKNNIVYFKNEKSRKKIVNPSGSNFNLIKPEIGVVIQDKSRKKKEVKDGGFEYIKKYNKPSMYEFSKLVMESSNLNSLKSGTLSSQLIESKVNEINEIKNMNKFSELNNDNYNGYILEFSDNLNPLFQNALSLNDKEKKENENINIKDNNNDIKEDDKYKDRDKNIFRAMEEGYLKSRYNSMNLVNVERSIKLNNKINNLYNYFLDDNPPINKVNTIDKKYPFKNNSAVRKRNNNYYELKAPLPLIRVKRVNVNQKEIKEKQNKIKGRRIINRFNYQILNDKKWGEEDPMKKKDDTILKKVGENIMTIDNNHKINKGLIKSASVGNIF